MQWNRITQDAEIGELGNYPLENNNVVVPMKKIKEYIGDCNTAYNELFDYLLLDFAWRKLHVDLNSVTRDNKNLVGFEIQVFAQGNKRQFVSTVTKEIIFEVELILPEFEEGKEWQPTLSYIEYWKEK